MAWSVEVQLSKGHSLSCGPIPTYEAAGKRREEAVEARRIGAVKPDSVQLSPDYRVIEQ